MTLDSFAMFKFKEIEGKLENFYSHDMTTTRFVNGFITYYINYDITSLSFKIIDSCALDDNVIASGHFKDLVKTLKDMGFYKERTTNRHSSSYIPFDGKLE